MLPILIIRSSVSVETWITVEEVRNRGNLVNSIIVQRALIHSEKMISYIKQIDLFVRFVRLCRQPYM